MNKLSSIYIRSLYIALIILALLIAPGLGWVGVSGLRELFDNREMVAKVNGHRITRQAYEAAVHDKLVQMRQILGGTQAPLTLDTPEFRQALLEDLIQQYLIADAVQRKHLTASDEAVRTAILAIPVIAQLRQADDSIDIGRYRKLLADQGMTPEQFDQLVRLALASEQISENIILSTFVPEALAKRYAKLSFAPHLEQIIAQSEFNAYLASLRARAKVKIFRVPTAAKD